MIVGIVEVKGVGRRMSEDANGARSVSKTGVDSSTLSTHAILEKYRRIMNSIHRLWQYLLPSWPGGGIQDYRVVSIGFKGDHGIAAGASGLQPDDAGSTPAGRSILSAAVV
jgi:hypothetical protein